MDRVAGAPSFATHLNDNTAFNLNLFFAVMYLQCGSAELTQKVEELEKEVQRFKENCEKVQQYQEDLFTVADIWVWHLTLIFCNGMARLWISC